MTAEPRYIRHSQIAFLYDNMIRDVIILILGASGVTVLLYFVVDRGQLLGWYAAMCILATVRLLLLYGYRQRHPDINDQLWARAYTLSMFVLSLAWSYTLVMTLPPVPLDYAFAMQTILTGTCILALYQLYYHPTTCFAFMFPLSVSWTAIQFYRATPASIALGVMSLGFFVTMIVVAITARSYTAEKLELKADVEQQKDNAEKANLAKSKFLAAASHDLRQPLYAMALFTTLLQEKIKGSSTESIVNSLAQSLGSLERLLDALLDVSKLDAGSVEPHFGHVDIQPLLNSLGREFKRLAEEKGLALEVEVHKSLVYTDPVLLELVLRNLINNAVRYTDSGKITVTAASNSNELEILVKDTGMGIAPEAQETIFDEFVQLHNPQRNRSKGLGLGLSIVRRITRLLDGRLELHSEPGVGSKFSLFLPPGNPQLLTKNTIDISPPTSDISQLSVWVFEDDAEVRHALMSLLENWGCRVTSFDGKQSLHTHLNKNPSAPHVVLADYMLGEDYTGKDAIQQMLNHFGEEVPAIIITGDTNPQHIEAIKALGYHVMRKPAKPAQLRAFLGSIKKDLPRQLASC
ncbi:MAG: ATP-binding protein [Cellvibrionaceae bacterium]